MKPGRNDPCPCGSGKKFKKCCYDKFAAHSAAKLAASPAAIDSLVALFNAGRYDELESQARLVVEHYPDSGLAWKVLGVALLAQSKDALPALQKAAQLLPDDAETHNNLGLVLAALWQLEGAMQSYRRALEIKPDFAEAYNNLGNVLKDTGRLDEAIACYRRAVELDPDYTQAHSNLIYILYFHPAFDEQRILAEAKQFGAAHSMPNLPSPGSPVSTNDKAKQRLRIGYVSPDFRDHCQSLFTLPLLSNHDHAQFEIYCYAQLAQPDAISTRLSTYADVWRSTNGKSDAQLAEMIASDGIDILIDLTMHMSNGRPMLFARRAAPVQVAWLAYPGTTGIPAMDYRLTDPWLDPPGLGDDHYTEKTVRLADTFWCYAPLVSGLQPNSLPALSVGHITFGCLNNFCKVSDDTLCRWGQIMARVPASRLILMAARGQHRLRVLDLLGRQGVAAERIEFVEFQPRLQYLQTYLRIDLCLDTLPYNGHTTSLDAYWMGVPVVTQVGHTVVGRAGWSQLNNLGLSELTAFDEQTFIDLAVTLATDLHRLSQLRQTLRSRMEASPLMDGKRFTRAIENAYRQIWQRSCGNAEAHCNLGTVFEELGQLDNAEASYRKALEIKPELAEAHSNLGNVLRGLGRFDEALASYHRALEIKPDYAEAHYNLGNALRSLGQLNEAVASYVRALEIKADFAEAHYNLGNTLHDLGQLDDAVEFFQRALAIKPTYAEAYCNLGTALEEFGQLDQAAASYRHALEIKPDFTVAYSNLLFVLNYQASNVPAHYLEDARRYGQIVAQKAGTRFAHARSAMWPERLRVGLVSGDLLKHPVGYFLEGFLTYIDPARIELIAYSTNKNEDELTARIRPCFSAWKPIFDKNDEDAARLIHADGLHILLDISGHTRHNRLPVFAWKPAPVQVSWLGYFATTGMAEMDYLLADKVSVPEDQRAQFTESIWYLPDTRLCFTAPEFSLPVTPLPALANGLITFGCFQNLSKVNDEVLATWGEILAALLGARLRIQCRQLSEQTQAEHLAQRLQSHGIDLARVELHGAVSRVEYLAAHAEVDMILDTFPYPGGTTTCEALWMGVPTLTLAGDRLLARQGASLLTAAGLAEWVAETKEDYLIKAIVLSGDLSKLAALRADLRKRVLASPLFDTPRFAKNFEHALWEMCGFQTN